MATKSDLDAHWAPIQAFRPYKIQCRIFNIDNNILQNVLSSCLKYHTTLTGLLLLITLVSLATQLSKADDVGLRGVVRL
ncbi:hypothetical protein F4779DRAFT_608677 [Xylariaceae sp. FL0662B]|nr:hypothetical protein F4779DRAFT_608677 [Xylariaceae sp. FL0662B]